MTGAPRAAFASFDQIHEIYYTTDDGYAELRPREEPRHDAQHVAGLYEVFERYEEFRRRAGPGRGDRIHLASVVGGLYGLNLIPIFRPREITFFDVNPHAVSYFNLIRRVWVDSDDAETFLGRLTHADYAVHSAEEEVIRRCIAAMQHGTLTEEEGRSARSFLSSWRYALDHFELTRTLLAEVPVHTRVEAMHSASFKEFVAGREDLWIYCSNVFLFVFFDLTFRFPENAALFASYFDQTEMLDVAAGRGPVTVHCGLPMSITGAAESRPG